MRIKEADVLYPKATPAANDPHWSAEWLVTNALGGYASGTVQGLNTRAYHGYLIAALPAPFGRTMMLNEVYEDLVFEDGKHVVLNEQKLVGESTEVDAACEVDFRLELGLPVWTYQAAEFTLERRMWFVHWQNTAFIEYRLLSGPERLRIQLRPAINIRSHEAPVDTPLRDDYQLRITEDRYEIWSDQQLPPLRLQLIGLQNSFAIGRRRVEKIHYLTESNRGYASIGELWIPGEFSAYIERNHPSVLVASTESWDAIRALTPEASLQAEQGRRRRLVKIADPRASGYFGQQLVFAADQFVIEPTGRIEDSTRAKAAGDEIRTVIAGYHWFTDWGRDTMISLEGLTLTTGRSVEASYILRTFAHAIRDGLIPNLFPEGSRGGLYHTADATMWFFHALDRYLEVSDDEELLLSVLPILFEVMNHHIRGTHFGIRMDSEDALLKQGEEGYQLTWMDAKVDGWVVTPRRGKAVEINALWYNALRLLEHWSSEHNFEDRSRQFKDLADKVQSSFNNRFWFEEGGYLFDVVDGEHEREDASFRPNQIFAISLKHPVLDRERWEAVLLKVKERLLTPVGLRSLAPGSKDYCRQYYGDLRSRDAAYHQGTVWAWLIGPFIDAWLKVYPDDRRTANAFLDGFKDHLGQACIGSISEIFDAEEPYTPRGCIAQAWSIAEVLRCLVKTTGD